MNKHRLSAKEVAKIHDLRGNGSTVTEIAKDLDRSKSTIFEYIKGIDVPPEILRAISSRRGGSAMRAESRRRRARLRADSLVESLGEREMLIILACLYWGEGDKSEFGFSNSDPRMVKVFTDCLKRLGLGTERIKVSIRIYEDLDLDSALLYWSGVVGINKEDIVSVNILKGKKIGKLPYGMCRIRIEKGNDYFNLLTATVELISEKFAPIAQRIELRTPKP